MGCLLRNDSDEQDQHDHESWRIKVNWKYDLAAGLVLVVFLLSLLAIAGAFN